MSHHQPGGRRDAAHQLRTARGHGRAHAGGDAPLCPGGHAPTGELGGAGAITATTAGLLEQQYDELLNFESSDRYDERQKAALAYAEAIAWRLDPDDVFWERMHSHFTEPELVELGCFLAASKSSPDYWAAKPRTP